MSVSNILLKTGVNAGKIDPIYVIGGGGGGGVASVTASAGAFVDNADANNPIVGVGTLIAGDLIVGTAVPHIGAVLQQGANGTFLGVAGGALGYQAVGGSGTITGTAPLTEYAIGAASNLAIDFVAKGDLIVGGGAQVGGHPIAGNVLPIGADTAVLTADSTATGGVFGMKWEVPTPVTGGQIQRITAAGTTVIPAPTAQNASLQIIDTASGSNTFVYEPGRPCPDTTFTPGGAFNNEINGTYYQVVFGNTSGGRGQVWLYEPSIVVASVGVWTKMAETIQGNNIQSGSCLKIFNQNLGQYGPSQQMVFGGDITDITWYGYAPSLLQLTGLFNFFIWDTTIVSPAMPLLAPNFGAGYKIASPYPPGAFLCGVAEAYVVPGQELVWIMATCGSNNTLNVGTPFGSVNFNGIALFYETGAGIVITPLEGGDITSAAPVVNGIFGASGSVGQYAAQNMTWNINGDFIVNGGFTSVVIAGAALPNSLGVCILSFDLTPGSHNGMVGQAAVVAVGNGSAVNFRPCYDPTQGYYMAGDFLAGTVEGLAFVSPLFAIERLEQSPQGGAINAIGIDSGEYVSVLDYDAKMGGLANGYYTEFGYQQGTLDWFMTKIPTEPLAFIGFFGKQIYQGYYKTLGAFTTISFNPCKVRYSLPSGSSGLASTATINSVYSSMTLIGDLPPNTAPPGEWDLVAYTGNISFS